MIVHKQLPFVAELINNTELYFYVDEVNKNHIIRRLDLQFFGAYSVYHTTKSQLVQASQLKIKSAKWIKNLC